MIQRSGLVRNTHFCGYITPFLAYSIFVHQVSGGFATVHPNNKLTINAVEAAPLDAFSVEVSLSHRAHFIHT